MGDIPHLRNIIFYKVNMETFTLVLNNSNVVSNSFNTQFRYQFLNGSFKVPEDSQLCISNITLPYSWFNVSQAYGNNTFSFTFPQTAGATSYTVTLPDGFYLVSDINNYLQQFCITNGLYLINSSGQYVYYLVMASDTAYYANQLLFFPVPTSLPSGYTAPSNWVGYPASTLCPTLTLPATTGITSLGVLLGFSAGTYGGTTTSNSILSNITPVGSTVNSLTVRCTLVNNNVTFPSDIVNSLPINATFGSNIIYTPSYEQWVNMKSGVYNNFTITFQDQNFNQIFAKDPNVSITLVLRKA